MGRRCDQKNHKEWSKQVRDRDQECVVCGKTTHLNSHHLIPHQFKQWEFHVDNGITLCSGCHTMTKFSAHKNPIWFVEWMRKNRPRALQRSIERMENL